MDAQQGRLRRIIIVATVQGGEAMTRMFRVMFICAVAAASPCTASIASAAEEPYMAPVRTYVRSSVLPWIRNPTIIAAILAQNTAHATLTEADILKLDEAWQTGFAGHGDRRQIDQVLDNTVSRFLKEKKAESRGVITEVFVMDNRGLIVGASAASSDYWQGDEDKFRKTFGANAGAMFIDSVEKDDSSQTLQSQASLAISDDSGKPIGAITVGIDLEAL